MFPKPRMSVDSALTRDNSIMINPDQFIAQNMHNFSGRGVGRRIRSLRGAALVDLSDGNAQKVGFTLSPSCRDLAEFQLAVSRTIAEVRRTRVSQTWLTGIKVGPIGHSQPHFQCRSGET